jgi:hypothetical protein
MRICLRFFILFLTAAASAGFAQTWEIPTPRQVLPVPSDGSTVNFPNVNLITGMKYRVHATQRVTVSNSGDIADACYYVNVFPFAPGVVPVSMKLRNSPTNEDWFNNFWNAAGLQTGYQSSHVYDASVPSLGSALSFRFFDRADPPSPYYGDNSGSIMIDVAQETPGIAIWRDTLNFGNVRVGIPQTLPDSIWGYGVQGYTVDNVKMLGASASKFSVSSSRVVTFNLQDAANEFRFTYSPTNSGPDAAEFHIYSNSAFGTDKERIIYLFGNGVSTQLSFSPDTLDFGNIRTNTTKTLPDSIINLNISAVNITSIAPESPGSAFSVVGPPLSVLGKSVSTVQVKFSPKAAGKYSETFDVLTDDGSQFHFYARGGAGVPLPEVAESVLYFGKVLIGKSSTLYDQFGNDFSLKGPDYTPALNVTSTQNTNPAEYTVIGNLGTKSYEQGHSEIYTVTFTPNHDIPNCGNHDGSFIINYDDGTSTTITFKGCDHSPLNVKFSIDSIYYVSAGDQVDVIQKMITPGDPLDSTIAPVDSMTEQISFDATLFDFVSVGKAALINDNRWNVSSSILSPGIVKIAINSTTLRLDTSGHLISLRFKAHSDDQVGQFTYLVQRSDSIKFNTMFEPLAVTSPGKITISDICTPVQMSSGNPATSIEQNNPNPFNPTTHIHYAIGKNSDGSAINVKITLYDALGRFIKTLVDEPKTPGTYDYLFDGDPYSSGAYVYIFHAGDHVESKTMVIAK